MALGLALVLFTLAPGGSGACRGVPWRGVACPHEVCVHAHPVMHAMHSLLATRAG